ncbi:MAG: phasin family protein [Bacteroidota bacterium]
MNQTIQDATRAFRNTADTLVEAARDVYYAGIGLAAMIEEEVADGFDALVREGRRTERGRVRTLTAKAVTETKEDVREARQEIEQVGEQIEAVSSEVETRIVEMIGTALNRMNIPTRDDVESLKRSVDRLNKKAVALRSA